MTTKTKHGTRWLCTTALLMAMNIIMSMSVFSVPVPGGHLYLNDVIICFAALILDPLGAFCVGGVGAFLGDFFFYPTPMFVSLVTHGLQAVVISLCAHRMMKEKPVIASLIGVLLGAVIMVVGYSLGRAFIYATPAAAIAKLPYQILQALVGAALSTAGVCYQGMFRNPMVSPDILGASTGAGFGAAVAILLGAGYFGISAAAFCCGLLAVAAAWLVSRLSRTNQTVALILAGMMISSLFSAGTSFVKLVADTQQQLPAITYWLMGSLSSIKDKDVLFLSIPVTLGMVPLLVLRWRMNLLTLGEEEAQSMGVNTRRLRGTVIVCATLLTSASVAVSGMIGWVGLVIPHFCRMLFGYDYRRLIPAGALFGASFLLIVDDIARLVTTGELPLGILTAFVGAPLFVYLIVTGGRRRVH